MKLAYKIQRNVSGDRFVLLSNNQMIPADICGVCVGADKWLSEIECKCRECKEKFPLSELHGGGQWCEECQTVGIDD